MFASAPPAADPSPDEPDGLLGRITECHALDALLAGLRRGQSGHLVIRGEAGSGKTTLLAYAVSGAADMRVLRARGVAFESGLAFSALHELLGPILDLLDCLPAVQADALRSAFALGDGGVNRLAVYSATLSLLTAASTVAPVLCLVDDAHWVDQGSAEALLFAARRLRTERVALVLAARELPGFAAPGLPDLWIPGLDPAAGVRLAMRAGASPRVAAELVEATAGNPLALVELPATLSPGQLQGCVPLDWFGLTAPRIEDAFLPGTGTLPAATWRALVVCAAAETGPLTVLARALTLDGLDLRALDPAVAAGLVRVGGEAVAFRHRLVRLAVYSAAGPGLRQAAHRAVAAALTAPADADRRAWQAALATLEPDERLAAALADTADQALDRGGVPAQARALERAAALSPDPESRAPRLLRAAGAWLRAGAGRHAELLLDEAIRLTRCPELRCRAQAARGYLALQRGELSAVGDAFTADAESAAVVAPLAAAQMLSAAVDGAWARLDLPGMLRVCQRVAELGAPQGPDPAWPGASIRLAGALVLTGHPEGAELARACVELCETHPADGSATDLAEILIWLGDYGTARRLLDRDLAEARRRTDLLLLAHALPRLAVLESRTGRLSAGHRVAEQAVQAAGQVGQRCQQAHALATAALVAALLGDADACHDRSGRARSISPPGSLDVQARLRYAHGLLALGAARYADALVDLEWVADVLHRGGLVEPGMLPVAADLAECYARLSRPAEATEIVERLEATAAHTGRIAVRAAAARCRGLLATDATFEEAFGQALSLHDVVDAAPLERARTLLCSGQRLRRAKRRRKARQHLYAALALFEQAGAVSWAGQCRTEIDATGQHSAPRATDGGGPGGTPLTAQEWQIALGALGGLTNREIADRVYLSPKTVDYHLGHIYRKLGLRSRHELIRHLSLTPLPAPGVPRLRETL